MSPVDASSVSPTRAVPVIAGAPVASAFDGPDTVAVVAFDSGRPSGVQTAPAAAQSVVAGNDTVTASAERGRTVIVQRWFFPCATLLARVTVPLVARSASSRSFLYDSRLKSSLNRNSKLNSLPSPSCSDGTSWNDAVSGGSGGATRPVAALVSVSSLPASSVNVTRTLIAEPSSDSASVYVASVASAMSVPSASHW